MRVRIRHQDGYRTIYGHMLDTMVGVGDQVAAGQQIGRADNTGNSTGSHLHLTLKHDNAVLGGDTYIGYPYNIVNPEKHLERFNPKWPPKATIDLLPYFKVASNGRLGPFYVMQHNSGHTEDVQIQVAANGDIYLVKNHQYERLRVSPDGYVERAEDTSPGDGLYYALDDGHGWSRWCPQHWAVGEIFERKPLVSWYRKANCVLLDSRPPAHHRTWLKFAAYHDSWQSPDGVTMLGVVEFHWLLAPDGEPTEWYWFAPGVGLVQWKNCAGMHSWISEMPMGREPLQREVLGCL